MRKGLIILSVFSFLNSNAQEPNFQWAKQMGGTGAETGNSIITDAGGNVYTTGQFSGTADFDPGPAIYNLTSTSSDIFVSKLSASGNFQWAKQIGGTGSGSGKGVAIDANGNVYITGTFSGSVDFDPGSAVYNMSSNGQNDIFVLKLDVSGNFLWVKQIGGLQQDATNAITLDAFGNVYTTGFFQETVDFNPGNGVYYLSTGTTNSNIYHCFVSKLDASGNFVSALQFEGSSIFGTSIKTDGSGNIYTTGYFSSSADFDPGAGNYNLVSFGSNDIFVSKLDPSGNFIWAKQLGGSDDESANSLAVDLNGNVYTTGGFWGTADFDPGPGVNNLTSFGFYDIFVSKLDAAGNFVWAKQMGGANWDIANSITVDANSNVFTAGFFRESPADFDPGPGVYNLMSFGFYDIFVSKLDAAGNFVWAKQMGGTGEDNAYSLTVDQIGNVYTTGYFKTTADFDPGNGVFNLTSFGQTDVFVTKFGLQTQNSFTTGSIVILRVGDGNTSPSGDYPVFLDEYSISGNFIQSIPLPTTASGNNNQLILPGLTNAQGYLTRSSDKNYLVMTGYARNIGGSGTLATVGTIDKYKNINTTTVLSDYFTPRSATSTDGTKFWMVGTNGVRFANRGTSTSVQVSSNQQTNRSILISNGQLYVSNGGALASCIGTTNTGLPENVGDSLFPLPGLPNTSAYQFVFFDQNASIPGPDVLYIALESSVQKYSLVGSTWVLNGTISSSLGTLWRGITGQIDATNPNHVALYITQNASPPGKLVLLEDYSGYNGQFTGTPFVLATSPANTNFKGIALSPGTSDLYYPTGVAPKLYISKAVLNVNETQVITGQDFTPNGAIYLSIKNELNEIVGSSIPITYIFPGKFTYSLPITNSFQHGEYRVFATDINTSFSSPQIKFKVNNPSLRKLWVTEPNNNGLYYINKPVQIVWKDYVTKTIPIGVSGYVQKMYKIEYTNDNGNSWQLINNNFIKSALNNQNNQFTTNFTFSQPGTYKIRVTDLENALNNNTSVPVNVASNTSANFTYTLEWDKSIPNQTTILNPLGLAAEGTARVLIRLNRVSGNTSLVKKISATINPDGNSNASGTELLGKILPAKIPTVYNLEGNNATSVTCDTTFSTPSSNSDFWFWLIAPDDFTDQSENQDAERLIKVVFTITYADNSTVQLNANGIRIVRPPLIMVHGLNGSPASFDNIKYNLNGTPRYFINAGGPDGLFKRFYRPWLKNYGSFAENAEILLGIGDVAYRPQSIQRILKGIHDQGFAANRLDYVCHSMGGCVARTMINKYDADYRPTVQNTVLTYKNYGNGFINKLITINTPHNGSPVADLVNDLLGSGIAVPTFITSNDHLGGFFVKKSGNNILTYYDPSPAIKDLRAVNGGIRFNTTNVKNHLIGGDIDRYNIPDASLLIALNSTGNISTYLTLMKLLMPQVVVGADATINTINAYISLWYNYPNYLSNSDIIVPVSSQFPNLNQNNIRDLEDNAVVIGSASIGYGVERNHIMITDDTEVGTTIMRLLNAKINSGYFENQIPANTNPNGTQYLIGGVQSIGDSILYHIDTNFIKINSPNYLSSAFVDSTLNIEIQIKDTSNLKKIQVIFQGNYYESFSKVPNQSFNIKVNSDHIGLNLLISQALYDSSGYYVYHIDTASLITRSLDTLNGFYLSPKSQNLNKNHSFNFQKNAIYTHYIGVINDNIDSLSFQIADTNVVRFDSLSWQFTTKDTGTTYIVYNYRGFTDTAFVYVTETEDIGPPLPITLISFTGSAKPSYNLLEWKTASEVNFSHFTLQRSLNGSSWIDIGKINAQAGPGGSASNYDFRDSLISNTLTFYRLIMVDLDGKYKTSNTVLIRRGTSPNGIKVFPNPVTKSQVFIDLGNPTNASGSIISLFDQSGKSVRVVNSGITQNNIIRLDLWGLKPSVYMLKVQKGDNVQVFKLVVLSE